VVGQLTPSISYSCCGRPIGLAEPCSATGGVVRRSIQTMRSNAFTPNTQLYSSWKGWCDERGLKPGSARALSDALCDRGYVRKKTNGIRGFKSIVLQMPSAALCRSIEGSFITVTARSPGSPTRHALPKRPARGAASDAAAIAKALPHGLFYCVAWLARMRPVSTRQPCQEPQTHAA
jgi:hypothetical protein